MKRRIDITVTYLEMKAPPAAGSEESVPGMDLVVQVMDVPDVAAYRDLYDSVGERWLWWERRAMADGDLLRVLSEPGREVYVLRAEGREAGFAELVSTDDGAGVQIVYFGLKPGFIGRGIGGRFLRRVVDLAWRKDPGRVWLHTCTLDHPSAIRTYVNAGFTPYRTSRESIEDPRDKGLFG